MADRGGSISEEDNKPVQHNIQEKGTLLRQLCSAANDLHEKSGNLDNIKQLSSAIDMMRNIPARVFENNTIYSQLHECIDYAKYKKRLKKEKKQRRAQRKETRIGKLTDKASKLAERMHNKVGL